MNSGGGQTLGAAVRALEDRLFVGRERELALFARWLQAEPSVPEILDVSGPGGVGKSALLGAFQRIAAGAGRVVALVDGRTLEATPAALLQALGGGSLDDVAASLNRTPTLLLLDTFEALGNLTRYLQEQLLPRLSTSVRIVIAGRRPLGLAWSRGGGWHALIRPLPLERLSPAEARAYLSLRGISAPRRQEQVIEVAHGHPLALSLAADMVQHLGVRDFTAAPEWHLIVRTLVDQLLEGVEDTALRELLYACAIVRQFDESALAAISGQSEIGAAFSRVCDLSVVRAAEHGLMLHDDVRHILLTDLRWRRPDRYSELRLRALAHYRQRMRTASPVEREWLMLERLFLWEDGFVQRTIFEAEEPGEVWVHPAGADDIADLLRVWTTRSDEIPRLDQTAEAQQRSHAIQEAAARLPGARGRIARDRDGEAVGYSMVLPVTRDLLTTVYRVGPFDQLIRTYLTPDQVDALPTEPERATMFAIGNLAFTARLAEPTRAALLRDLMGIFSLEGTYFGIGHIPAYRTLLEAYGFRRLEGSRNTYWSAEQPIDGYVLDLSAIGVEPWIEALIAGRRPPRAFTAEELQRELQAVLLNWQDDAALAQSPLLQLPGLSAIAAAGADDLRRLIRQSLADARTAGPPQDKDALDAVDLAYLQRAGTHEQIAERLSVSRATFYRLLKRGIQTLAGALDPRADRHS